MKPEGDDAQGGTNDILSFAGEEKDGTTTIVFKRKIDTGDSFDRVIKDMDQVIKGNDPKVYNIFNIQENILKSTTQRYN